MWSISGSDWSFDTTWEGIDPLLMSGTLRPSSSYVQVGHASFMWAALASLVTFMIGMSGTLT